MRALATQHHTTSQLRLGWAAWEVAAAASRRLEGKLSWVGVRLSGVKPALAEWRGIVQARRAANATLAGLRRRRVSRALTHAWGRWGVAAAMATTRRECDQVWPR